MTERWGNDNLSKIGYKFFWYCYFLVHEIME